MAYVSTEILGHDDVKDHGLCQFLGVSTWATSQASAIRGAATAPPARGRRHRDRTRVARPGEPQPA